MEEVWFDKESDIDASTETFIDKGQFGVVKRAVFSNGSTYALKIFTPAQTYDVGDAAGQDRLTRAVQGFIQEARIVNKLNHPNVLKV
jgi:serine/threonine protein kinase